MEIDELRSLAIKTTLESLSSDKQFTLLKMPCGCGKTYASISSVRDYHFDHYIHLTPFYDNLVEIISDYSEIFFKKPYASILFGKVRLCKNNKLKKLFNMGITKTKLICDECEEDCKYSEFVKILDDINVLFTSIFYLKDSKLLLNFIKEKEIRYVYIDEDPYRITQCEVKISYSELLKNNEFCKNLPNHAFYEEYLSKILKVYINIILNENNFNTMYELINSVIYIFDIIEKGLLEQYLEEYQYYYIQYYLKKPEVLPKKAFMNEIFNVIYPLYRWLKRMDKYNIEELKNFIETYTKDGEYYLKHIFYDNTPYVLLKETGVKVINGDATGNPLLFQKLFELNDNEFEYKEYNAIHNYDIIEITSGEYPISTILSSENTKKKLFELVKLYVNFHSEDKKIPIICKKVLEKEVIKIDERLVTEHYFNLEGKNKFKDYQRLILLGTPYMEFDDYNRLSIYFNIDKNKLIEYDKQKSMEQSIGRIRTIINPGKEILKITNFNVNTLNSGKVYRMSVNDAIKLFSGEYYNSIPEKRVTFKELHNKGIIYKRDILEYMVKYGMLKFDNNNYEKIN